SQASAVRAPGNRPELARVLETGGDLSCLGVEDRDPAFHEGVIDERSRRERQDKARADRGPVDLGAGTGDLGEETGLYVFGIEIGEPDSHRPCALFVDLLVEFLSLLRRLLGRQKGNALSVRR